MARTEAQKKRDSILKKLSKKLPEGSVFSLKDVEEIEFISTGVSSLDYAYGGGWPRGWMSMVFGGASVGKSALTYTSIAKKMQDDPDSLSCVIDLEKSTTPKWVEKFGVDPERLVVVRPSNTEEMIKMTMEAVTSGIFDFIVVDSLGAGLLQSEIENDKSRVAGSAGNITRMVKAVNAAIIELERKKRVLTLQEDEEAAKEVIIPSVILINQVRVNMASMYGEDTFPGGKALGHMCGIVVQLKTSKATGDKILGTVDGTTMRVGWLVNAAVTKSKVSVPYKSGAYNFVFVDCPETSFGIDNAKSIVDLSISLGIARVEGKTIYYEKDGEEKKVVGRNNYYEVVKNDEDLQRSLGGKISEIMSEEGIDEDLKAFFDDSNEEEKETDES